MFRDRGHGHLFRRIYDFWAEDENSRFFKAMGTVSYPPDLAVIGMFPAICFRFSPSRYCMCRHPFLKNITNWSETAAQVRTKTVEQCDRYANLYFDAASHHKQMAMVCATVESQLQTENHLQGANLGSLSQAQGKTSDFQISAHEVYAYHGVAGAYADFLNKVVPTLSSTPSIKTTVGL